MANDTHLGKKFLASEFKAASLKSLKALCSKHYVSSSHSTWWKLLPYGFCASLELFDYEKPFTALQSHENLCLSKLQFQISGVNQKNTPHNIQSFDDL